VTNLYKERGSPSAYPVGSPKSYGPDAKNAEQNGPSSGSGRPAANVPKFPEFKSEGFDRVEYFKYAVSVPVPASNEGSVIGHTGPRSATATETLREDAIREVFRDRSLSRTAMRDPNDHVTASQHEQLDTEISQLTFAPKIKTFGSPDGLENIYGVPNYLVPGYKRPNYPREFIERPSKNPIQPIVLDEIPTDGWVPNWRELTKGQDLTWCANDQEVIRACYGSGYTEEIAEHLSLKEWTYLGKSQKGAWGGKIKKDNEDKRAEALRIANMQAASSANAANLQPPSAVFATNIHATSSSTMTQQGAPTSKAMPSGGPPDQGGGKKPDPFNFADDENDERSRKYKALNPK
jgi:hypothetical protein